MSRIDSPEALTSHLEGSRSDTSSSIDNGGSAYSIAGDGNPQDAALTTGLRVGFGSVWRGPRMVIMRIAQYCISTQYDEYGAPSASDADDWLSGEEKIECVCERNTNPQNGKDWFCKSF